MDGRDFPGRDMGIKSLRHYKYFIGCRCYHEDGREKIFTACMYDQLAEGVILPPTLVLKSLWNITREDSIAVGKMIFFEERFAGSTDDQYAEAGRRTIMKYFFTSDKNKSCSIALNKLLHSIFPYLCDNGYDVFMLNESFNR